MPILQGTPIRTDGVHPLAQLMSEGTAVMQRAFGAAAAAAGQQNQMAAGFIKDATRERMASERMRMEREQAERNRQLKLELAGRQERMQREELAARERMAAMRAAGRGGSGGGGGGGGYGPADSAIDGVVGDILGRRFGRPAPEEQAATALPEQDGPNPSIMLGGGGAEAAMPLESPEVMAKSASLTRARQDVLSGAGSYEGQEFDEALAQNAADQIRFYGGLATDDRLSLSDRRVLAGKAITADRYLIDHERRISENLKLNDFRPAARAVDSSFDPMVAFFGTGNPREMEDRVNKDPSLRRAAILWDMPVAAAKEAINQGTYTVEGLAGVVDVFSEASHNLELQRREALLKADVGPNATVKRRRKEAAEIMMDSDKLAKRLGDIRDVVEDRFTTFIEETGSLNMTRAQRTAAYETSFKSMQTHEDEKRSAEFVADLFRDQAISALREAAPEHYKPDNIKKEAITPQWLTEQINNLDLNDEEIEALEGFRNGLSGKLKEAREAEGKVKTHRSIMDRMKAPLRSNRSLKLEDSEAKTSSPFDPPVERGADGVRTESGAIYDAFQDSWFGED